MENWKQGKIKFDRNFPQKTQPNTDTIDIIDNIPEPNKPNRNNNTNKNNVSFRGGPNTYIERKRKEPKEKEREEVAPPPYGDSSQYLFDGFSKKTVSIRVGGG